MLFINVTCGGAWADDFVTEHAYFQELPVVLSASRLNQPLSEAPNAMTVIDRKMIIASGFRTIPDLFKLVPGMYVSYYKGSQAFVSYHGSTDQYARRMQVLLDGRSVYMPPASTVDWANLPITIDDIERIEVIRGPAAASHGANSTQGVISIMTRDAGAINGKSLSVTRGSKGINDISARFGNRGEAFDYRMTLAYSADNGYDSLSSPPNNIPITQAQAPGLLNNSNDSNQARLLNYRADYHPNGIDNYDIQLGFNHDVQGVGFNDKDPNPAIPLSTNANTFHDLLANSGYVRLGWIRLLENNSEFSLHYGHIQQNQHEALSYFNRGIFASGPIVQSLKMVRDEVELQHILPLSTSNRLVYGAAYRVDRINGYGNIPELTTAYSMSVNTSEYRVFAHDEWRITPKFMLNSGAMLERDGMGNQNISPRVALNVHVLPKQTLRMGVSVAYRTPSLIEERYPTNRVSLLGRLYAPGAVMVPSQTVTSPGLVPERLVSREIGYLGEFSDWATSVDIRLFSDQVSNGIYIAKTNVFANGVSSTYQGIEAAVKYSFNESSDLAVNFARELASSNAPSLLAAGNNSLRSASPCLNNIGATTPCFNDILSGSVPKNSASLLFSQRLPASLSFSAAYYYQSAMQPFDRGSIDYQPIQRRADVRIAKSFRAGKGIKGSVALIVQNLLNQGYTEYVANNLFNRRAFLSGTIEF